LPGTTWCRTLLCSAQRGSGSHPRRRVRRRRRMRDPHAPHQHAARSLRSLRSPVERTPMAVSEGANYAPDSMPKPVVEPGEFVFAAMHLDHGHIGWMTQGLLDAGGTLKWVYDTQPERAAAFKEKFPHATRGSSEEEVLEDPEVHLVAAAAVPVDRAP